MQTSHIRHPSSPSIASPTPVGTPTIKARCRWMGSSSVVGVAVLVGMGVALGKKVSKSEDCPLVQEICHSHTPIGIAMVPFIITISSC